MEENVREKIAVNLDFTEDSNFIRKSTEIGVRRGSGINSPEKNRWKSPNIVKLLDFLTCNFIIIGLCHRVTCLFNQTNTNKKSQNVHN